MVVLKALPRPARCCPSFCCLLAGPDTGKPQHLRDGLAVAWPYGHFALMLNRALVPLCDGDSGSSGEGTGDTYLSPLTLRLLRGLRGEGIMDLESAGEASKDVRPIY